MVMLHWRPDGLKPHAALWAWLEAAFTVRDLSCWQPAERDSDELELGEIACAPDGREARYRAGRVSGPAEVLLRYPARGWQRGRRLHVEQTSDQPLYVGTQITLRAGEQLVFEAPEPMSLLAARVPRQPITFMYGNLVWGPFSDEVWAVYGLEMHSYEGRPRRGKIDLMGDLADAADGLEADFQLLRISRQWSLEDYAAGADATVDARHGHLAEWRAVIDAQRARLEGRAIARPEVYLALRAVALRANARGARRQRHARPAPRPAARAQAHPRALRPARAARDASSPTCSPTSATPTSASPTTSAASAPPPPRCSGWCAAACAAGSASPRWTTTSSRRRSSSTTTASGASSRSSTTCCGCSSRASPSWRATAAGRSACASSPSSARAGRRS